MMDPKPVESIPPTDDERSLNLEYWKKRLRELPDLRLDKVYRTRDALSRRSYDREDVLDATVDRVVNEIGVLCRQAE